MKKKIFTLGAIGSLCCIGVPNAFAQVTAVEPQTGVAKILHALPGMLIYSVIGTLLLYALFTGFDKMITRIDIVEELKKNNIAVGIFAGAFILGISIIVAAAMF